MTPPLLYFAFIILSVAVVANWLLTLALVRRVNRGSPNLSSSRPMGLKRGTAVPSFTAHRLDGTELAMADISHRRAVLVFVNPGCTVCEEAIPEYVRISAITRQRGEEFVLVSGSSPQDTLAMVGNDVARDVTVVVAPQNTNGLFSDFKVSATPLFTVIDNGRVVESGMAWESIPGWKELGSPSALDSYRAETTTIGSRD